MLSSLWRWNRNIELAEHKEKAEKQKTSFSKELVENAVVTAKKKTTSRKSM